jgi:two-component system phosphate regulon sensor histidine kinase PhoR
MLTVSVLLVVIIFLAFTYLFKTILTQSKLSELKNDFISNMTHEFKTPISTISLACQAMQDKDMMGDAIDKSTPFVTMIQQENKRLEVLVERILQSATIEKSDVPFKQEDINLTELVSELAAHARFRLKAVHGELDEILPPMPVWITADKMHTSNMISNLLDNAIKYSNGEPKITVNLGVTEKEIVLIIKDQGIGISKEHIGKIFDKLYRVPTGNVHNVKGFGLGLSYVKAIVDLNGWKITVNSQLGKGSEFCIRIPFIAK